MWAGLWDWAQGFGGVEGPGKPPASQLCLSLYFADWLSLPSTYGGTWLHHEQGECASSRGTVLCPTSPRGPSLVRLGQMPTLSHSVPQPRGEEGDVL